MMNHSMSVTDVRLLLPETLWLEPEHFEQAREISQQQNGEAQQWQAYLQTLTMLSFADWLANRLPSSSIQPIASEVDNVSYLQLDKFQLCLIATEHVLDEIVSIPKSTLESSSSAHFYVVLEVLEDQEQVIIRGFLRCDELTAQSRQITSSPSDAFYWIPLDAFDAELNHLIMYVHHLDPGTIQSPASVASAIATISPTASSALRTRLSQWLQGVLDEGWQTIDALINPEMNLAWSTRQTSLAAKGGKLINLGMQLEHQTVALLVTVIPEIEGKVGINVQVLPAGGVQTLPAQLKLTLLSSTDQILQEVQSRNHDNLIQLKPFRGKSGTVFSLEVSLHNTRVRETFEL